MNIAWFREFVVLADTCNYLEASEQLFISQSTLSKHIKALEDELGLTLFDRSTRKVRLSPTGQTLLPYARSISEAEFAFQVAARNQQENLHGKVVIDAIPTLPQYNITDIISEFQKLYPQYSINMLAAEQRNPEEDLRNGLCELAFIRRQQGHQPEADIEELPFFPRDDMVAVLPRNHPLAATPLVRLEQLRDEAFVTLEEDSELHRLFRGACQRAGFFPKIAFTCNEVGSILDLVTRGSGVALLMRGHTNRPKAGNFQEEQPFLVRTLMPKTCTDLNLCYLHTRPLSPAAKAFLNCALSFQEQEKPSDFA